jgi:hypothetical protein
MPRAKPPNPSPVFTIYPDSLSSDQRAKIAELLGYPGYDFLQESINSQLGGGEVLSRDPGQPLIIKRANSKKAKRKSPDLGLAILNVEQALSLCSQGARYLDVLPRAVHYRQVASSIGQKSLALLNELCELSDYYRDALNLEGADIQSIEQELAKLFDATTAVKTTYAEGDSRGRGKENALKACIRQLRVIFRKYATPLPSERITKGSFASRSQYEAAEMTFLSYTLVAVKAISKERTETKLARLLRDPACEPTSAR